MPVRTLNKSDGIAYGAEVTADWQIRPWWRTRTTYSHLSIDMWAHEDTKDLYVETQERDTPRNYVHVRSSFDVGRNVNADVMVSWVDDAPTREAMAQFTLNVRIGWLPMRNLEVSLVGQRLIDSPRIEYGGELLRTVPTRAEPSVYGAIAWRF